LQYEPGGIHANVFHDGAGNLTQINQSNGTTQDWSYDAAGRAYYANYWNATALFTQTATLDAAGEQTRLVDTWGTTNYTYDSAGRLHTASYPDGTGETDGYDAAGNRLAITTTGGVSGTVVVTNTYDLADELTSNVSTVGSSAPLTTTCTYDNNGNQLGSSGPAGLITNTYNLQNELVQVQGPSSNLTPVYNGRSGWTCPYGRSDSNAANSAMPATESAASKSTSMRAGSVTAPSRCSRSSGTTPKRRVRTRRMCARPASTRPCSIASAKYSRIVLLAISSSISRFRTASPR
jgi:YD repeat-containing protein